MPFLIPFDSIGSELVLVLAFGEPSYLEACCVFGDKAIITMTNCEDIAIANLLGEFDAYAQLGGVHKIAIPLPEVSTPEFTNAISFPTGNFNFSLSLYCCTSASIRDDYERLSEQLLVSIRGAGQKKANLIRSRSGAELYSDNVLSRSSMDFIAFQKQEDLQWGVTVYVPDVDNFRIRSISRPFVSSKITLSARLARLLVNLSGASKGSVLLDPFCGSGTILGEALLKGINCIGIDRNRGRVEQTKQNLSWLLEQRGVESKGKNTYSLLTGDATNLSKILGGRRADAIVSEPILLPRLSSAPSLKKAKQLIKHASRIYSEAIYSMSEVVRANGRIVLVVPSLKTAEGREVSVTLENIEHAGLRFFQTGGHTFEYPLRIPHQSTRWIKRMIYVLERP